MSYIEDVTEPLITVLSHHAGLPRHQVAGHAANAEFWIGEVRHRLGLIDGYRERFERMKAAQPKAFEPPLRASTSDEDRKSLRARVLQAADQFLSRLENERLLEPGDCERLRAGLNV